MNSCVQDDPEDRESRAEAQGKRSRAILGVEKHSKRSMRSPSSSFTLSLRLSLCQILQIIAINSHGLPIFHLLGPNSRLIEVYTGLVPLENAPLQPSTIDPLALLGQLLEEERSIPTPPELRSDEQIF